MPTFETLTPLDAALYLRRECSQISSEWEKCVREEATALQKSDSDTHSDPVLRWQISHLIERLAAGWELLSGGPTPLPVDLSGVAQSSAGRIIYELLILRKVVSRHVDAGPFLESASRRVFHEFIDEKIQNAANRSQARESRLFEEYDALLCDTQDRLKRAIEIAKLGFFSWDSISGRVVLNEQLAREWDLRSVCAISELFARIHPDDQVRVRTEVLQSLGEFKKVSLHLRMRSPDENYRWHEVSGEVVLDASSGQVRAFGTSIDIHNRKAAEILLAEEKHKLGALFRESPAAMALWKGEDFVFEMLNPEYQSIFGERVLIGKPLAQALPELKNQAFIGIMKGVLTTGVPFVGREMLARMARTEGGLLEDFYYDFSYVRISDVEGKPYGVFVHAVDVTARVLARQELEGNREKLAVSVRDLEKSQEMREKFVAALTHDLRTPLTTAKLSAELMLRKSDDAAAVTKLSKRVVTTIERADAMIRDLLDANRIGFGEGIPIAVEPCRLDDFLLTFMREWNELNEDRLRVENHAGEVYGAWDADGIRRILENLMNNAVKYGTENTPVTLSLQASDRDVEIAVHNEGREISAEDQLHLFDPYHRSANAVSSGLRGWGVGLTLVKGLAEAHGGSARVRSEEGLGTTFTIQLPRQRRDA